MKAQEHKKMALVQAKQKKEREHSKEKPDINASSGNIVEQKKLKIFEQIFDTLNPENTMFIDSSIVNYRKLSLVVIDIMMELFVEFEDSSKPWDKKTFIEKCNETYNKMPQGDRSELLKFYTKESSSNYNSRSGGGENKTRENSKGRKPEINQNSAQMCQNSRKFGVSTCEALYSQHQQIQRRKEQLKEEVQREQYKECTFRPNINVGLSNDQFVPTQTSTHHKSRNGEFSRNGTGQKSQVTDRSIKSINSNQLHSDVSPLRNSYKY